MPDATLPSALPKLDPAARERAMQLAHKIAPTLARRMAHETRLAASGRDYYQHGDPSRFRHDRRDLNRGHIAVEFDEREQQEKRGLSRWLWRNSPAYRAPILAAVDEVIGDGLLPMAMTPEAALPVEMFRSWFLDPSSVDVRGLRTGAELQREEMIDAFVDGDHGQIMVSGGRLQNVTADRIVNPKRKQNTPHLAGGVETDMVGRPIGYWVAPWDKSGRRIDPAAAERKDPRFFTLINCPDISGAVRTPPLLVSAFDRMQDLEYFIDATLQAAKFAASVGGVIESEDPAATEASMLDQEAAATLGQQKAASDEILVEPNMLYNFGKGSKISQLQAQHPNTTFDAFTSRLMRFVCAAIRFPYEIAMQDFGAANFSVARAIQMQAERFAVPWRRMYVQRRLLPIYRWKVAQWVAEGRLPADPVARERMLRVTVPAPPHRTLDIQKETAAFALAKADGQITEQEFWTARNRDWRDVKRQILDEEQFEAQERQKRKLPPKAPAPGAATPSPAAPGEGMPGAARTSGGGADNEDERMLDGFESRAAVTD